MNTQNTEISIRKDARVGLSLFPLLATAMTLVLTCSVGHAAAAGQAVARQAKEELPSEITQRKEAQRLAAPPWVQNLATKTIREYFPTNFAGKLPEASLERLLSDASRLHFYFEDQKQDGEFSGFVKRNLRPYIMGLNADRISYPAKNLNLPIPIADMTVESLLVARQVKYLEQTPNFMQRALGLVTGPHLRGATVGAGLVVLAAAAVYVISKSSFMEGVLVTTFVQGFRAGPVGTLETGSMGFWLRPTTEFLNVMIGRATGSWEVRFNVFYDGVNKAITKLIGTKTPQENQKPKNDIPNIGTIEQHGTNFGGMTAADQVVNWDKNLRIWPRVKKFYNQLLRDTHHDGRVLSMTGWNDEASSANLAETMDSKILTIDSFEDTLLSKTVLFGQRDITEKENLEMLFDEYKNLIQDAWMWKTLTPEYPARSEISKEIESTRKKLEGAGFSERDLLKMEELERTRKEAIKTFVAGIALNEARNYNIAESNRNLDEEAQVPQRALRKGLGMQRHVDDFLPLVQKQMREMGYQVSEDCSKRLNELLNKSRYNTELLNNNK